MATKRINSRSIQIAARIKKEVVEAAHAAADDHGIAFARWVEGAMEDKLSQGKASKHAPVTVPQDQPAEPKDDRPMTKMDQLRALREERQ